MQPNPAAVTTRLSVKALAVAGAVVFGGSMFLVALGNLAFAGYGRGALEVAGSIYPGYHGPAGLGSAVILGAFATVDGAIGGALLALIYNAVVHRGVPRGERFSA